MIKLLLILIYFFFRKFSRLFRNKKVAKAKKILIFDKNNLNNWMNLTKKERFNLSKQESINYLTKRKVLLEEIRKEYKKISKRKSN